MNDQPSLHVIKCSTTSGELLDVAGLNEITVLVDRSQTALTEIGVNRWHAGLEGPPHFHNAKEQMFFVLAGEATIKVGTQAWRVQAGDLLHVPLGVMHRTIVDEGEDLIYLLFNAFNSADKEGHASFADHIAKVKQTRRQQADDAADGAAIDWTRNERQGSWVRLSNVRPITTVQPVSLIDGQQTARCSATVVHVSAQQQWTYDLTDHATSEKTIYVLAGDGIATIGDQQYTVTLGDLLYVPTAYEIEFSADGSDLHLLSMHTTLDTT